ncbi:MAG: phosphoribosylamine--glycine ligase [Bacteroidales bacterium]|nr:phosphoribosylamine--glycine ligase [Bacteroidales bacterium]
MNVLLLGSGGREHAIAEKLAQSPQCTSLFVAPGNAGTTLCGENVALQPEDFDSVGDFVRSHSINMVVVGPEAPLVGGIADYFANDSTLRHVMVIGPSKQGAALEGSKAVAKEFMLRHNIPTARHRSFTRETLEEGMEFLSTLKPPYVLKADGLAAGKGVLILPTLEEARVMLCNMIEDEKFGAASSTVVIEEYLEGIELSVFVLTDGRHYKILPEAKDYKRIGEGDTGLNTGGMGAVSPVPFADKEFMQKVEHRIVQPTIKGLHQEKIDYRGFLFIGLMNCGGEPYVIEYNVRMGDPETEVVFPRIKSDILSLFRATWERTLNQEDLDIDPRTATCVMLVAQGYPEKYRKGRVISGLQRVTSSRIFHAGTILNAEGEVVTNGGRVIAVTSLAPTLPEALLLSYQDVDCIGWQGKYFRHDIGQDLLHYMMEHPHQP